MIFDFEKPASRNSIETILTLASMSCFVIADISESKSIIGELNSIVPQFPSVPIQPIIEKGDKPWGMFDSIYGRQSVLPLYEYSDLEELLQKFKEIIINRVQKMNSKI